MFIVPYYFMVIKSWIKYVTKVWKRIPPHDQLYLRTEFQDTHEFQDIQTMTGVLLTNLGTPDAAATPSALRKYLAQFFIRPAGHRSAEVALVVHSARCHPEAAAAAFGKGIPQDMD